MTLHFICTGNIYRSRLAQAYIRSKSIPGLSVISSGTHTSWNGGMSIAPYATEMLRSHGLEAHASPSFQQTTKVLIEGSDILVFMEREHHHFCKGWLDRRRQKIAIWNVPDIGPPPPEIMVQVKRTFGIIRERADELLIAMR
jgi:protein-tyrosine-phosphatase